MYTEKYVIRLKDKVALEEHDKIINDIERYNALTAPNRTMLQGNNQTLEELIESLNNAYEKLSQTKEKNRTTIQQKALDALQKWKRSRQEVF